MGKKSPPAAPDLKPLTDAQLKIAAQADALAREQLGLSRQQFEWFQSQGMEELALARQQADRTFGLQERAFASDEEMRRISSRVAESQLGLMDQAREFAERDRARYEERFLPMQDRFIDEANAYDTPERREQEAARAMADVQGMAEQQRAAAEQRLSGMGIDPSQFRSGTVSAMIGANTAAAGALQANNARTMVEDKGRALRADALNLGMGLPAQASQGMGMSAGAGGAAVGAAQAGQGATLGALQAGVGMGQSALNMRSGALNNMSGWTGNPMQWAQMGQNSMGMQSNSIMNAGSLMNSSFQNNMQRHNAVQEARNQTMSMIGGIAGAAMSFAEGGVVPGRRHYAEGGKAMKGMGPKDPAPDRTWGMRMRDGAAKRQDRADARFEALPQWRQDASRGLMAMSSALPAPAPAQRMGGEIQPVYYAEGGGAIPRRQARDKIPAILSEGEYVLPADVVSALGIERIDKMVQKYHRPGA